MDARTTGLIISLETKMYKEGSKKAKTFWLMFYKLGSETTSRQPRPAQIKEMIKLSNELC